MVYAYRRCGRQVLNLTLGRFHSIDCAPEKALVKLRKEQREKIEEVKQKTNYYSMRNLIERYEEGPPPNSPAGLRRRNLPQPQQPQQSPQPQTPQTPPRFLQVNPQTPSPGLTPGLQQQLSRECTEFLFWM